MSNIIVVNLLDHEEKPLLIIPTRLDFLYFFSVILLKCPHWHFIKSQQYLVETFDQNIFVIFHISIYIDNNSNDISIVNENKIYLFDEFAKIVIDNVENNISIENFERNSRYETIIEDQKFV